MGEVWGRRWALSRGLPGAGAGRDRAGAELAPEELPLVGKTHRSVAARQGRGEGLKGAGQPQDLQGRLVDLRMGAGPLDRGLEQSPVEPKAPPR